MGPPVNRGTDWMGHYWMKIGIERTASTKACSMMVALATPITRPTRNTLVILSAMVMFIFTSIMLGNASRLDRSDKEKELNLTHDTILQGRV
jgi:hypothetical protein